MQERGPGAEMDEMETARAKRRARLKRWFLVYLPALLLLGGIVYVLCELTMKHLAIRSLHRQLLSLPPRPTQRPPPMETPPPLLPRGSASTERSFHPPVSAVAPAPPPPPLPLPPPVRAPAGARVLPDVVAPESLPGMTWNFPYSGADLHSTGGP